jgi:hypothetical protein
MATKGGSELDIYIDFEKRLTDAAIKYSERTGLPADDIFLKVAKKMAQIWNNMTDKTEEEAMKQLIDYIKNGLPEEIGEVVK